MVVMLGLLVVMMITAAHSASRFQVKSENLPATLNTNNTLCREQAAAKRTAPARFHSGQHNSDRSIVPADVAGSTSEFRPVVRFDIGPGHKQRRHRLLGKGVSVGEVSIDTRTGKVVLDGQIISAPQRRTGC